MNQLGKIQIILIKKVLGYVTLLSMKKIRIDKEMKDSMQDGTFINISKNKLVKDSFGTGMIN